MTKETENALAVVTSNFAVKQFSSQDIKELLTENVGTGGLTQFDLPQIKIPAGGSTTWTIHTVDGEEETKAIDGVIVLWKETRSYWAKGIEEGDGNQPPDCSSDDNIMGIGNPGGDCATCPLSQMGSGKNGTGQACKQVRHLFILRENDILPSVVNAAPASLAPLKKFFLGMVSKGTPFYGAKIRLELEKDKNAQNITYSKIKPSVIQRLTPEETQFFKNYKESMAPLLGRMSNFVQPTFESEE